jgi:hypothetical protein
MLAPGKCLAMRRRSERSNAFIYCLNSRNDRRNFSFSLRFSNEEMQAQNSRDSSVNARCGDGDYQTDGWRNVMVAF